MLVFFVFGKFLFGLECLVVNIVIFLRFFIIVWVRLEKFNFFYSCVIVLIGGL